MDFCIFVSENGTNGCLEGRKTDGKTREKKVYISFQYEIRFVRDKNNIQ